MTEIAEETEIIEARNLPAVRASEAIVARGELTVDEVVAQKDKILQIMQRVMTKGVHYGLIPGIEKPSLFKPGAEAINVALRLAPDYDSEKVFDGPHLTVSSKCILSHIPTGLVIASGEGLCSTRESKYAYRNQKKQCPACGAEAIIKGKEEYGGGWVCWKKEGGCGAKYSDGDEVIEKQPEGKVANPDLADQWNTVVKMANKRALVAAVLNGTAASDVFTQDVEDMTPSTPAAETETARDRYMAGYDDTPFEESRPVQDQGEGEKSSELTQGTLSGTGGTGDLSERTDELEKELLELARKLRKLTEVRAQIAAARADLEAGTIDEATFRGWLRRQVALARDKASE